MEKTKTIVSIGGNNYTICGTESAEYIHRVALKVNSKLDELKRSNPELNNIQLAMLTSINLADDYIKLSDENEVLRKEIERLQDELTKPSSVVNTAQGSADFDGTAPAGTIKFPPKRP